METKQNNLENDKVIKSSCSLFVVLVALFVIFILFVVFLIIPDKKDLIRLRSLHKEIPSVTDKINDVKLTSGEKLTLTLNEEELGKAVGIEEEMFPLKKASLSISREAITIKGKTSDKLLSPLIEVQLVPKIEKNKIVFEIKNIKTSGINAPKFIADPLSEKLKDYMTVSYESFEQYSLEEVQLGIKQLSIIGTKK